MVKEYVPDRGDIVWIQFSPHRGHEQGGHRPALIITPNFYNVKSSFALLLPITSKQKGWYPFQVELTGTTTKGYIISDQIKSLDWKTRGIQYIETVPSHVLAEALKLIHALVE